MINNIDDEIIEDDLEEDEFEDEEIVGDMDVKLTDQDIDKIPELTVDIESNDNSEDNIETVCNNCDEDDIEEKIEDPNSPTDGMIINKDEMDETSEGTIANVTANSSYLNDEDYKIKLNLI